MNCFVTFLCLFLICCTFGNSQIILRNGSLQPLNVSGGEPNAAETTKEENENGVEPKKTDEVANDNATCGKRLISDSGIVGENQPGPGRWPWQALLAYNSSYRCGGTLINDAWVLTAARCFDSYILPERYNVWLGYFNYPNIEELDFEYSISQIYIHKDYDSTTFENDIALISLSFTVKFTNYIVPACLPAQDEKVSVGKRCWISGWGDAEVSNQEPYMYNLKEAEVSVVDNSACENDYGGDYNGNKQLCAGYLQQEIGPCYGVRGSPLICENSSSFVIQGIASFENSLGCAARDVPDGYTRVSNYICWIDATINDKDRSECNSGNKIQSHFYVAFLIFTLIIQIFWVNV